MEIDPDCKDFIEQLLQMKSEDRLGCPNTDHDMQALFNHPFLKSIDFNSDLTKLNIK